MHTHRKVASHVPRHETGLGRGALLEGDIILFEPPHLGEDGPMDIYRLVVDGKGDYDIHLLVNGYWIHHGKLARGAAKKRFAACWDAYQRVIS